MEMEAISYQSAIDRSTGERLPEGRPQRQDQRLPVRPKAQEAMRSLREVLWTASSTFCTAGIAKPMTCSPTVGDIGLIGIALRLCNSSLL